VCHHVGIKPQLYGFLLHVRQRPTSLDDATAFFKAGNLQLLIGQFRRFVTRAGWADARQPSSNRSP
jgi:hypothetical protein